MTDGGAEGVTDQPHGEADDMCITLGLVLFATQGKQITTTNTKIILKLQWWNIYT